MFSIHEHLRRIAGLDRAFHLEEVKIFFKAPNPHNPSSKTLTIGKAPAQEANFQWVAYQVLFSKAEGDSPRYYIYSVYLESGGQEKLPNKVFESDSAWSAKNKDRPSVDLSPGDAKREFPEVLKGPELFPAKYAQTVYVNTDPSDRGKEYSDQEFEKLFKNNFYIVLSPHSKELRNPFGDLVGEEKAASSGLSAASLT